MKKLITFILIAAIALSGVAAADTYNPHDIKVNLSSLLSNLITTGVTITSSNFGNMTETIDPTARNTSSFTLSLPRYIYFLTENHGVGGSIEIATSKEADNTRNNTFGLNVTYAYRMPFKNDKFSMVVSPGLSIVNMVSGTPDAKTSSTLLAIVTELDFRYHFNDTVYISAGLENTTMFASFATVKVAGTKTSENNCFFQNYATIPNIGLGFTF